MRHTVLSLFSGGMGLDLGLAQTGRFALLGCVEENPSSCETIRANQSANRIDQSLLYQTDIRKLHPKTFREQLHLKPGDLDLLVGGPPCQTFSTAGNRASTQDPRGTLLWECLRFIQEFQPKFFLLENVRGLWSASLDQSRPAKHQPGSVIRKFFEDLQKHNPAYRMDCFEVNAVNYGVPQIRERLLLVGNRFCAEMKFPSPSHGGETPWRTLREAWKDLTDPNPEVLDFSPRKKTYLSLVPEGSNWRSLPESIQKESMGRAWFAKGGRSGWWRRLTLDLPSPTLVTMPNHSSTALCHPVETRALSIKEYARIQEFPDAWEFVGTLGERYAQIGNAVPPRLARIAGELIATHLTALRDRNWEPYEGSNLLRRVPLHSHIRTRKWFNKGEPIFWTPITPSDRL